MKIGIIGLGKMGNIIAERVIKGGYEVFGYDSNVKAQEDAQALGVTILPDIVQMPQYVRVIWIMVPTGKPLDAVIEKLIPICQKDDIIIDGGNSLFTETIVRHDDCARKGIHYLDCGTSGGVQAREHGFSLMIGGEKPVFEKIKDLFRVIAAPEGYAFVGPSGSGHYVKTIHNGIEYSMLQAYAEGFHLLKQGHYKNLDLAAISNVWRHGSVVRSWILELLHEVLAEDQNLDSFSGEIGENLTGRWAMDEAKKQGISMDLLERSLFIRGQSRQTGGNYATKLVALLRNKFGGHPVKKAE